jgi:hypothetical protein
MKKNNLIKVILSSLLSMVIVTSSMAQASGSALSYGAKAGITSSGFTHYGEVFTFTKQGLTIGGFAEYELNKMFGVAAELNYLQQGAFHLAPGYIYPYSLIYIQSGSNYIYMTNSDVKLHTLDIPVLFTVRPDMDGNIVPKFLAGLSFDFILKARSKNLFYQYLSNSYGTFYSTLPNRETDDVSSSFKTFNICFVGGLGLDFKTKQSTYTIEARYNIGLNHINNLAALNNGTNNTNRYYFSVNTLTISLAVSLQ